MARRCIAWLRGKVFVKEIWVLTCLGIHWAKDSFESESWPSMAWQIIAWKGWYGMDALIGISQWKLRTGPAWHHGYTENWQRVARHVIMVDGKIFLNGIYLSIWDYAAWCGVCTIMANNDLFACIMCMIQYDINNRNLSNSASHCALSAISFRQPWPARNG